MTLNEIKAADEPQAKEVMAQIARVHVEHDGRDEMVLIVMKDGSILQVARDASAWDTKTFVNWFENHSEWALGNPGDAGFFEAKH